MSPELGVFLAPRFWLLRDDCVRCVVGGLGMVVLRVTESTRPRAHCLKSGWDTRRFAQWQNQVHGGQLGVKKA